MHQGGLAAPPHRPWAFISVPVHRPAWPLSHENENRVLRFQTWFPGMRTLLRLLDCVWVSLDKPEHGPLSLASPVPFFLVPRLLPSSPPKQSDPSFFRAITIPGVTSTLVPSTLHCSDLLSSVSWSFQASASGQNLSPVPKDAGAEKSFSYWLDGILTSWDPNLAAKGTMEGRASILRLQNSHLHLPPPSRSWGHG